MAEEVKIRTVYVLCHKGSDIGRDVYVGERQILLLNV